MPFYYKRKDSDVIITAIKVKGYNHQNVAEFCGKDYVGYLKRDEPRIDCTKTAKIGEYIIRDIDGELYTCSDKDFKRTYKSLRDEDYIKFKLVDADSGC